MPICPSPSTVWKSQYGKVEGVGKRESWEKERERERETYGLGSVVPAFVPKRLLVCEGEVAVP